MQWLVVALPLIFIAGYSQGKCKKCDIDKVKAIEKNYANLTYPTVQQFLCTLDESCKTNVEYSEWSNEIIYKLLNKHAALFFEVLTKEKSINKRVLLTEIENPLLDYDFQLLSKKVVAVNAKKELQQQVLEALKKAAKKK
jgi:hypothetical protein